MLRAKLYAWRDDERGVVTVDWVVLTAALVGLGAAIAAGVGSGTTNHADGLSNCTQGIGKRLTRDFDNTNLSYERKLKRLRNACKNWAARS